MLDSAIDEKLYQSGLKLIFPLSEQSTYKTIVEEGQKLVNGKYASLFTFNDGNMERVFTNYAPLMQIIPRKHGITMKAYTEKKAFVRTIEESKEIFPLFNTIGFGSDLTVPLVYGNKTFGVLSVLSQAKERFGEEELKVLEKFSPLASLSLHNMQLREKLAQQVKVRDFFISLASHELKTPLTAISLYTEMLSRTQNKSSENLLKEKLTNEVGRLKRLVNDLLQVDKIQLGMLEFEMEKCNLGDIIKKVYQTFRDTHKRNSLTLRNNLLSGDESIYGNADKLTQVLTNLLDNSVKYSKEYKPIYLSAKKDGNTFVITVEDKGNGIAAGDLEKIFSKFYQGENNKKEGLGLGLYLVKYIIEKHKGNIKATSIVGEGTTMTITLPAYTKK